MATMNPKWESTGIKSIEEIHFTLKKGEPCISSTGEQLTIVTGVAFFFEDLIRAPESLRLYKEDAEHYAWLTPLHKEIHDATENALEVAAEKLGVEPKELVQWVANIRANETSFLRRQTRFAVAERITPQVPTNKEKK